MICEVCNGACPQPTPHLRHLCATRPGYRQLFQGARAETSAHRPCRFLIGDVRTEPCDLGCKRGTRIKVVRCASPFNQAGEASIVPYATDQPIPTCKGCDWRDPKPTSAASVP